MSPSTISELNKKAYVHIEEWRNRPLKREKYPYVYVDGIYLRRNWCGEFENVSILVVIAVNQDGYREVIRAVEGMKEDKASWISFFQWLKGRGLDGVKLMSLGMLEENKVAIAKTVMGNGEKLSCNVSVLPSMALELYVYSMRNSSRSCCSSPEENRPVPIQLFL